MEKVIENQKIKGNPRENDVRKKKEVHRWRKKNFDEIISRKKKLVWKRQFGRVYKNIHHFVRAVLIVQEILRLCDVSLRQYQHLRIIPCIPKADQYSSNFLQQLLWLDYNFPKFKQRQKIKGQRINRKKQFTSFTLGQT